MAHIKEYVEKFAKSYGFTNSKYYFERGSQNGDNYNGEILRGQITGDFNGAEINLQLILKSAPTCNKTREALPTRDVYIREMYIYTDVIPVFNELQAEIPKENRCKFPKCLAVNTEDLKEILVMEDLMLKCYKMHKPRLETLDFDHASLALKAIAKFHALSHVLKAREPEKFKEITDKATDVLFEAKCMESHSSRSLEQAVNAMGNEELRKKMNVFSKNGFETVRDLAKPTQYSVLNHGDYWKNNMLFFYQNGKPVKVCPLDYQVARYTSPLSDILYFIFTSTSQSTRKKHFWQFLQIYYESLGRQLRRFRLDIDSVLPKSEYMKEVKRVGVMAVWYAAIVMVFMTCTAEDVPDPAEAIKGEKIQAQNEDSESYRLYKERITGVVEDCIEYGFF